MSVFNVLPSGVNTFSPTFWKHPDALFKKACGWQRIHTEVGNLALSWCHIRCSEPRRQQCKLCVQFGVRRPVNSVTRTIVTIYIFLRNLNADSETYAMDTFTSYVNRH
jgi:hypothetical protein